MNNYELMRQAQQIAARGRLEITLTAFAAIAHFLARVAGALTRQGRIATFR